MQLGFPGMEKRGILNFLCLYDNCSFDIYHPNKKYKLLKTKTDYKSKRLLRTDRQTHCLYLRNLKDVRKKEIHLF